MACCLCFAIGAGSVVFAVVYFVFNKIFSPGKIPDVAGKHVMITGGSSGIGLEVAASVIRRGASVTLVARDKDRLEAAQKRLQAGAGSARVHIRPFDVTSNGVASMVTDAEAVLGPVFMLVNCAGYSTPARFEDITMDQVKRMMDVNFFGTFAVTQCVVRGMKQREVAPGDSSDRRGIVVLTSSQGGMVGVYGFTGYAATKAALIKFAEALHMEVLPHRLSVTVCVPPDTDTPGFEQENVSKPTETRLVSESAGLAKPEAVAEQLVRDALAGRFYSTTGVEGFMVTTLCAGMAPLTSFWDYCAQGAWQCRAMFWDGERSHGPELLPFREALEQGHRNDLAQGNVFARGGRASLIELALPRLDYSTVKGLPRWRVALVFLSGFFRAISVFFLYNFSHIVRVEHEKRMNSKKKE